MKKKIIALLLVLLFVCACTACGGDKEHAGEWILKGAAYETLLTEPDVLGISASLSLDKNGSGRLTIDEEGYAIKSWSFKDGQVSIKTADETIPGLYEDGYVILGFDDGISLYFAKNGQAKRELLLLNAEQYAAAYQAMVDSGDAMPVD